MVVKNLKIFGERNSGTNFITSLLENNVFNINIYTPHYKGGTGWKHGFPNIKLFTDTNSTLFIFIIRDLEPWIKSMFFNPYGYKKPTDIQKFITGKLDVYDVRLDHDVYKQVERQNIINLRYEKIKAYQRFFNVVNNAIFVNLEDIQTNPRNFLFFIKNTYNLNIQDTFIPVAKHTKNGKPQLNRQYDLEIPPILNKQPDLENFVHQLKSRYTAIHRGKLVI